MALGLVEAAGKILAASKLEELVGGTSPPPPMSQFRHKCRSVCNC